MLTIQMINGKHCPVLLCHKCKRRIEDHDDGIAIYEKPGDTVSFLHRACEDEDAHQHHYSLPLDFALVQAALAIGIDWDETVRNRTKWMMMAE